MGHCRAGANSTVSGIWRLSGAIRPRKASPFSLDAGWSNGVSPGWCATVGSGSITSAGYKRVKRSSRWRSSTSSCDGSRRALDESPNTLLGFSQYETLVPEPARREVCVLLAIRHSAKFVHPSSCDPWRELLNLFRAAFHVQIQCFDHVCID